jgi:hypothetical protein
VIWPPDGLNLKQGTQGDLFGYGYLPLPLTTPKGKTAGEDVPTGNHCWTLFLNTANFKGPLAFFTPYFWSKASVENSKLAGLFLDSRPSEPNKAVQMETQHIPAMVAKDRSGVTYARIAPTHFPNASTGEAPLIHQITAYKKAALWNQVDRWFGGSPKVSGAIDPSAASTHTFKGGGYSTWQIYLPGGSRQNAPEVDWASYATPIAIDRHTYGIRWNRGLLSQSASSAVLTLPEYYRLTKMADEKERWVALSPSEVPAETGLRIAKFPIPKRSTEPYVTPIEPSSSWKKPGPVAGPFKRNLGDGSEVTYYWYRFADQPALLNADLTAGEREALQKRVEQIHRSWTKDRNYLPPNKRGKLASIDPALIVKPPKGYEHGYVPIVTRQGWRNLPEKK